MKPWLVRLFLVWLLVLGSVAPVLAGRGSVMQRVEGQGQIEPGPGAVTPLQVTGRLPAFDRPAEASASAASDASQHSNEHHASAKRAAVHAPGTGFVPTRSNPLLAVLAVLLGLFIWVVPAKNLFFPNSTMQRRPPPRLIAAQLRKMGKANADIDPEKLQIRYKPSRRP